LNRSAISPLYVHTALARFAGLTIDLRSMFAPAFGLRSQDRCLEPLGHLSVNIIVIPNPASSGEGSDVPHLSKSRSLAFGSG
jgi:hypothetical protein